MQAIQLPDRGYARHYQYLEKVIMRIPPLPEQHRIVSKLESIFAQIDAVRENLEKLALQTKSASGSLAQLKSSVLKQAFEGKLTTHHLHELKSKFKLIAIGQVPNFWDVKSIKELFYVKGRIGWRGLKKSHFIDADPYLITGVDFLHGSINWNRCVHIPTEKFLESPEIIIQKHDILFTKDGTIGKVAYIDHVPKEGASLNAHILLIRNLPNNKIYPRFAYYAFQTPQFMNYAKKYQTGTTRAGLSQKAFENICLPIPPLSEQHRIVSKLESIFAKIDAVWKYHCKKIRQLKHQIKPSCLQPYELVALVLNNKY